VKRLRVFALLVGGALPGCNCGHATTDPTPTADTSPTAVTIPSAAPQGSPAPWAARLPSATASVAPDAPRLGDGGAPAPTGSGTVVAKGGPDPLEGHFTLDDAAGDLPGTGALVARIETPRGALECKLYETRAPVTVANFVGLARGIRPWKTSGNLWVKRPLYDGTTFHRIVRGFMIQGGDPKGDGNGNPGYFIADESWAGATHDRAGLLCMANAGKNTNGSQFFITDGPATHLDGSFTIFGECTPLSLVHALAAWPTSGEQAINAPVISRVTISRR